MSGPARERLVTTAVLLVALGLLGAAAVRQREDLEFVGRDGLTRVQRAAAAGDADELHRLLAEGADPDARAGTNWRVRRASMQRRQVASSGRAAPAHPLSLAARAGSVASVRALLDAGAQPAPWVLQELARDGDCLECVRTILSSAPRSKRQALAQGLFSLALDEWTPARDQNRALVELALKAGADPNAGAYGRPRPVLHELIADCRRPPTAWSRRWVPMEERQGHGRAELLRTLLQHGAKQDRQTGPLELLPYDRALGGCADAAVAEAFDAAPRRLSDGPDGHLRAAVGALDPLGVGEALAAGGDPDQRLASGQTLREWVRPRREPVAREISRLLDEAASSKAANAP